MHRINWLGLLLIICYTLLVLQYEHCWNPIRGAFGASEHP